MTARKQPITEEEVLRRLREICLALPEVHETTTFGHPTFQVKGKTFVVLEEYKGELSICVSVGKLSQDLFLQDPRFYRTPYIGHRGWVSLKVHSAPLNWREIKELAIGSCEVVRQGVRARTPSSKSAKTASKG